MIEPFASFAVNGLHRKVAKVSAKIAKELG
jgi:hypothetical protein